MRLSSRLPSTRLTLAVTLALAFLTLGAWVGSASAALTHPYTGKSFATGGSNSAGPLGSPFSNPQSIAVEQSTGNVYVYDAGAGSVYKFNAAGEQASFSSLGTNVIAGVGTTGTDEGEIAVDNSSGPAKGDIYVATGEDGFHVRIYDPAGKLKGELKETAGAPWGEPCGVAVDPAGNVYVGLFAGSENSHINKYTPTANPVSNANYVSSLSGLNSVCNIAADSTGDIYADTFAEGPVTKYAASQFNTSETHAVGSEVDKVGSTLATDPTTNELYVDEISDFAQYNQSDGPLGRSGASGSGALSESYGVAVYHASGQVYADNSNGLVEIFGPAVVVPDVSTEPASNVTPTGARLLGTVNPDEVPVSSCEFEYGTELSYGSTLPCSRPVPFTGSTSLPVSGELRGLQSNTTYHYRLVAKNANGASYGSDQTFTTPPPPPTVTIMPATEVAKNSATFNGTVNPNGFPAKYHFEDSTDGLHWTALAEASAGEGAVELPVSQAVNGLAGNTTYHVRLVATTGRESSVSEETTFSTAAATPQVFGSIATHVSGSEAKLSATIDPEGEPATYQFQYGTSTAYGSSAPAHPDEELDATETVTQLIAGLRPDTVYHYRVIATNAVGTTTTIDQTFTTLAAGEGEAPLAGSCPNEALRAESNLDPQAGAPYSEQLPDCRAYEQVTPPFKSYDNLELGPNGIATASVDGVSNDGSPVLVQSVPILGEAGTDEELTGTFYGIERDPSGWVTSSLTPPGSTFSNSEEKLPSPQNVAAGIWGAATPAQSIHAENYYRREANGTFVNIGPIAPPSQTEGPPHGAQTVLNFKGGMGAVVGASTDLSRVVFNLDSPNSASLQSYLWPGDGTLPGPRPSLYEYVGSGHSGENADVPALVGADNAGAQISQCGTGLGADVSPTPKLEATRRGISQSGSTVFFNAQAGGCEEEGIVGTGPNANGVYARIGSPGAQVTVNVAGTATAGCAASVSCNLTSPVKFQGASSDGSKVFFTTEQALLPSDKDTTSDLYECELPGDSGATPTAQGDVNSCPNLKAITATGTSSGADVLSVVAVSETGARVYFTATGVLTGTPNSVGRSAEPGKDNLYLWETPAAGEPDGHTAFIGVLPSSTPIEAQSTPNGSDLVFTTTADLTIDDTSNVAQAFRYDAEDGELLRVSTGQDGFNADGNTDTNSVTLANAKLNRLTISEDGSYIVFQSSDALTPQVQGAKQNVYEWHNGQVHLISDGTDTQDNSGLIGIDASGEDIYFVTADKLVGQDTDEDYDLYDARINGGFPAPTPEPSCSGESCQGPLNSSLTASSPLISSTGLPAIGNLAPPKKTTTSANKVEITKHSVRGSTITLSFKLTGAGGVSVTGVGIKTVRTTVAKPGTYTLRPTLTAKERKLLKHRHKLGLKLKVAFTPVNGKALVATITLTVKA